MQVLSRIHNELREWCQIVLKFTFILSLGNDRQVMLWDLVPLLQTPSPHTSGGGSTVPAVHTTNTKRFNKKKKNKKSATSSPGSSLMSHVIFTSFYRVSTHHVFHPAEAHDAKLTSVTGFSPTYQIQGYGSINWLQQKKMNQIKQGAKRKITRTRCRRFLHWYDVIFMICGLSPFLPCSSAYSDST